MPNFIPGIELSRRFYLEAVRPLLDKHHPSLPHAAARIGGGSDVLGFDTAMSTDHDWGPTVRIFLRDQDEEKAAPITEMLRHELPHQFLGYPVGVAEDPNDPGVMVMHETANGPVEHRVYVLTLRRFIREHLDHDIDKPLAAADWLSISSQKLRELTAGAVHHDDVGDLTALRRQLAYYPHDVWLYLLASAWQRIGQEEHLMPRASYAGDELGASLIGSRMVRDLMNLCFLIERVYAPYPKWFGTAFRQLSSAASLSPLLRQVQLATTWQEREAAIVPIYEYLARKQNALNLTEPQPEKVAQFFGRPFKVIWGENFATAIAAQITDPAVKRIVARGLIGSIDQFSDSTDLRSHIIWRSLLRNLYS